MRMGRATELCRFGFLLAALLIGAPRLAAAQGGSQLTIHSEPGDAVGNGGDYSYDPSTAHFSATATDTDGNGVPDWITLNVKTLDGSSWWSLTFATNAIP